MPTRLIDADAAIERVLRSTGASVRRQNIYDWMIRGVRGVRLRRRTVGGRTYTTAEWLDEFLAATGGHDG